jgi:hypothetical protein
MFVRHAMPQPITHHATPKIHVIDARSTPLLKVGFLKSKQQTPIMIF